VKFPQIVSSRNTEKVKKFPRPEKEKAQKSKSRSLVSNTIRRTLALFVSFQMSCHVALKLQLDRNLIIIISNLMIILKGI